MNNCTDSDAQEMLPDLLHGVLANGEKARVEAHLATCESCQEDLDVLRTVKNAAIFAPSIDVDRVVRQIPPYQTIIPATERPEQPATVRPVRSRAVSWAVAASFALVVVAGGSILLQSNGSPSPASPGFGVAPTRVANTPEPAQSSPAASVVIPKASAPTIAAPQTHALALAADADGLSDGSLVQLMNDMDGFDALPASEPDPVISVDSGDSL
jgi:predicted anti-sigma-YlaC factor YlaD